MRYVTAILLVIIIACDRNKNQPINEKELLRKELHSIDWNTVDTYPSYDQCDSLMDKEQQKMCFFNNFYVDLKKLISNDSVIPKEYKTDVDSFMFEVSILPNTNVHIHTQIKNEKIDSLISCNKHLLKPIYPVTKRGIPVKSKFYITILIN